MRKIIQEIDESVRKHGYDRQQGLAIWLDYLIDLFDVKYIIDGTFEIHLVEKAEEDENLYNATIMWLEMVAKKIDEGGWIDVFGEIYEEMYQSKGKSSMLGQFFTPTGLCDLMANMNEPTDGKIGDPACLRGSHLRATTILRFVDEWYSKFTKKERDQLYNSVLRDVYEGEFKERHQLCGNDEIFMARYNPDNQYRVTLINGNTVEAFKMKDRYYVLSNRFIDENCIIKVEKI